MKDAAKRDPSAVASDANPLQAYLSAHPGVALTIARGVGIGAGAGIGIGLILPGKGAWYRALVALLVALGGALVGGLIAGALAIPRKRFEAQPKFDWAAKVDTKMKSGTSTPVPRRFSLRPNKDE